jgi:hypothetical protein
MGGIAPRLRLSRDGGVDELDCCSSWPASSSINVFNPTCSNVDAVTSIVLLGPRMTLAVVHMTNEIFETIEYMPTTRAFKVLLS